jgi:hypothetical protein
MSSEGDSDLPHYFDAGLDYFQLEKDLKYEDEQTLQTFVLPAEPQNNCQGYLIEL